SSEEARLLAAQLGGAKVHTVRWSVIRHPTKTPFAKRHGIAFIGGYGHPPNLDAARWLIGEIMPRVRERDPTIECLLVGDRLPAGLRQRCGEGVVALGAVEDLAAIFERVRLTVAPRWAMSRTTFPRRGSKPPWRVRSEPPWRCRSRRAMNGPALMPPPGQFGPSAGRFRQASPTLADPFRRCRPEAVVVGPLSIC